MRNTVNGTVKVNHTTMGDSRDRDRATPSSMALCRVQGMLSPCLVGSGVSRSQPDRSLPRSGGGSTAWP